MSHPRKWLGCLRTAATLASLGVFALAAFCITPADETALRCFTQAVDRWQINPEFRSIAIQYSLRGSDAAAARFCGIPVRKVIIAIRSMPGLPARYAVSSNSRNHYNNFSRGPLSAYLFLCSEQNLPTFIEGIEAEAHTKDLTESKIAEMLNSLNLGFPIANDRGACQSVSATLVETNALLPFLVRDNMNANLLQPIARIASRLQFPPDPQAMTFDQQHAVLERLDGYVRQNDPQLWRSKQISDLSGGIWAQAYGPPYNALIKPILLIHDLSKIFLIVILAAMAFYFSRKRPNAPPAKTAV